MSFLTPMREAIFESFNSTDHVEVGPVDNAIIYAKRDYDKCIITKKEKGWDGAKKCIQFETFRKVQVPERFVEEDRAWWSARSFLKIDAYEKHEPLSFEEYESRFMDCYNILLDDKN